MASKLKFKTDNIERRRKLAESTATFGLLLICVALVVPFASPTDLAFVGIFKWVYSAGALIFTIARIVGVNDPSDSRRLRRLRRLEFWAGVAFIFGAAFWFYKDSHLSSLGQYVGVLAILRDTIMLTLAGALIQIIASWMIVSVAKKEKGEAGRDNDSRKQ